MCLICVAPRGTDKYSEFFVNTIKGLVQSYGDGCGYAAKINDLVEGPKIWISKGYFDKSADMILDDIKSLDLREEDELMVHGRGATCGLINDTNCHPFVISNKEEELNMIEGWTDKPVMAHNGLIDDSGDKIISDTYQFVRDYLSDDVVLQFMRKHVEFFERGFKKMIGWSKMSILFPDRDLLFVGNWEEHKGYLFSNQGYKKEDYRVIDRRDSVKSLGDFIDKRASADQMEEITHEPPRIVAQSCKVFGFNSPENMKNIVGKQLDLTVETKQDIKCRDLVLNTKIGEIDHTNWDHFYFIVRKGHGNEALSEGTKCVLGEINKPKANELIPELLEVYRTNERGDPVGSAWVKHFNNIKLVFDIIPRPEYYEQYEDYCIILNKKEKDDKTAKAFRQILNKNHKPFVYLKEVGHAVVRESVEMVLDRWENNAG